MKILLSLLILTFSAVAAFSADAAALFGKLPTTILKDVDRTASIASSDASRGHLKLRLPSGFTGEFIVLGESAKETIVALSVYSCDESDFEVWRLRGAEWKDISKDAAPKIGKNDVVSMLAVSPVTVEKLGTDVSVAYFFTFGDAGDPLKLVVRKQSSCEIAGAAKEYRFDGKKFR